jgi:hypothetical protein
MWCNTKSAVFFLAHANVFAMGESGNIDWNIFPQLLRFALWWKHEQWTHGCSFNVLRCLFCIKEIFVFLSMGHHTSEQIYEKLETVFQSYLRQDKLSSMFHLVALHLFLISSWGISNPQLPKLNKMFPVSFSTLSCTHDILHAVGIPALINMWG